MIFFVTASGISVVQAWDSIDLELFDLVEEIKDNFYDILGVKQVGKRFDQMISTDTYNAECSIGIDPCSRQTL